MTRGKIPQLLLLILTAGAAVAAPPGKKSSPLYLAEISFRSGYHIFSESSDWTENKKTTLEEDLFFRKRSDFNSKNVDTSVNTSFSGLPSFSLELLGGIKPESMPGLRSITALHGFRGFRAGVGMIIYPFASTTTYTYSGPITYNSPNAAETSLEVRTFNGKISMKEDYLLLAQSLNFYYYHEKGFTFGSSPNKLIPYGGVELGLSFVNGKRKVLMESNDLAVTTVANGLNYYNVSANVQESFFNAFALRITPTIGAQYHVGGPHYFDIRAGFVLQNTPVTLTRTGTFTEKATTPSGSTLYTVSEKVAKETRETTFSMTGFTIQIGYTVGLL